MKLRNKKTGEIVEPFGINLINGRAFVRFDNGKGTFKFEARSLAELNEEWEDVPEEPKEYWYIDIDGGIMSDNVEDDTVKVMREIGNYFETEEETEKAVRKLKAWKRLEEAGFEFKKWKHKPLFSYHYGTVKQNDGYKIYIEAVSNKLADYMQDLDLLFGGEECQ